ncbi:hypothetical protein [Streptomyces sp. NPDC002790]|uniref:hypothetical protein n=1 Tax=Streptomyces sp. NPDC002790 TaxID=3154431 RepID=UPI00332EC3DB
MFAVHDGRLNRDGRPFLALGVNYHPAEAGCRIWSDWDRDALRTDFEQMAEAGLTTVRLFLFWRDAQPDPASVDKVTLDRLRTAVATAHDARLTCVVSLFTVWMNGQLLDVPWRAGRNIWRDPGLLDAEQLLAREVARALRGQDGLLAYDLGDELWHIDPAAAQALDRADVADWQERIAGVLRAEDPGVLVLQANDPSGVFDGVPYGSDNSASLDLIGTHGFPSWAPGAIESTLSYRATSLVPFLVRASAAYGVPLVDEIGSYGVAERTSARYLGAALASAVGNGAAGALVWCWRDIASTDEPYQERPLERLTGLHRLDYTPRATMAALRRVVADPPAPAPGRPPQEIALYLPERMRGGGSSYLDGGGSAVAAFHAYTLLKRTHLAFDVTAREVTGRTLLLCPSVTHLTMTDLDRLRQAAEKGATVYLSMGDHLHGFPGTELTGVELEDVCPPAGKERLEWGEGTWPLDWSTVAARPTTLLVTPDCTVLARYPDGSPALTSRRTGRGSVLFTNAPLEAMLDRPGRLAEQPWEEFYRRLARLAGTGPQVTCDAPDVEVVTGVGDGSGVLLVNHAPDPVKAEVVLPGPGSRNTRVVSELAGKEWTVWNPERPAPGAE